MSAAESDRPTRRRRVRHTLLGIAGAILLAGAGHLLLTWHCPAPGLAVCAQDRALNRLKNRATPVPEGRIDHSVTLAAMLTPGEDRGRWREDSGAEIVGYVVGVWPGPPESANCFGFTPHDRDTHIALALTPDAPRNVRVITEVTPRWRALMGGRGADWSQRGLAALVGRRVRIRGWLLFDREHTRDSEHTNPGNPRNWRATAWEIHPVTGLEIVR